MKVPNRRTLPLIAFGLTLSVVAVGCGGSGKAAPTPVAAADGTTTTTTPNEAYTACLRQHGVDVPDRPARTSTTVAAGSPAASSPPTSRTPGSGPPGSRPAGARPSTTLPPGVTASELQAARDACASLMPTGGGPNGPGAQSPAFEAYASCLKDHGVTLPTGGGFGGVNRDDPAFKAADAICAPLRPTPSSTTSTTLVKP